MSPHPYPLAHWRGISGCPETFHVTVSFSLPDGGIARYRLDDDSVAALIDQLPYWRKRMNDHSDSSSGKPAVEVSSPLDGRKV